MANCSSVVDQHGTLNLSSRALDHKQLLNCLLKANASAMRKLLVDDNTISRFPAGVYNKVRHLDCTTNALTVEGCYTLVAFPNLEELKIKCNPGINRQKDLLYLLLDILPKLRRVDGKDVNEVRILAESELSMQVKKIWAPYFRQLLGKKPCLDDFLKLVSVEAEQKFDEKSFSGQFRAKRLLSLAKAMFNEKVAGATNAAAIHSGSSSSSSVSSPSDIPSAPLSPAFDGSGVRIHITRTVASPTFDVSTNAIAPDTTEKLTNGSNDRRRQRSSTRSSTTPSSQRGQSSATQSPATMATAAARKRSKSTYRIESDDDDMDSPVFNPPSRAQQRQTAAAAQATFATLLSGDGSDWDERGSTDDDRAPARKRRKSSRGQSPQAQATERGASRSTSAVPIACNDEVVASLRRSRSTTAAKPESPAPGAPKTRCRSLLTPSKSVRSKCVGAEVESLLVTRRPRRSASPSAKEKKSKVGRAVADGGVESASADEFDLTREWKCTRLLRCHSENNSPTDDETSVFAVSFPPAGGDVFASAGGDSVCVVNARSGQVLKKFKVPKETFFSVLWTTTSIRGKSDEHLIAASGERGDIYVLSTTYNVCFHVITSHTRTIASLTVLPSHPSLLAGAAGRFIQIHQLGAVTGDTENSLQMKSTRVCNLTAGSEVAQISFSQDGQMMLAATADDVEIWMFKLSWSTALAGGKTEALIRDSAAHRKLSLYPDDLVVDSAVFLANSTFVSRPAPNEGNLHVTILGKNVKTSSYLQYPKNMMTDQRMFGKWLEDGSSILAAGDSEGAIHCYHVDPSTSAPSAVQPAKWVLRGPASVALHVAVGNDFIVACYSDNLVAIWERA